MENRVRLRVSGARNVMCALKDNGNELYIEDVLEQALLPTTTTPQGKCCTVGKHDERLHLPVSAMLASY